MHSAQICQVIQTVVNVEFPLSFSNSQCPLANHINLSSWSTLRGKHLPSQTLTCSLKDRYYILFTAICKILTRW